MTQFDDPETRDAMRSLASPKLPFTALAIAAVPFAVIQALRVRNMKVAGIGVAAIALGVVQVLRGTIWIA